MLDGRKAAARNRKSSRMISAFGRTQCQSAWAEEFGISSGVIRNRLKHGWDPEDAVSIPIGANRHRLTISSPLSFSDISKNPEFLKQFRGKEVVSLLCSECGSVFERSKEGISKSFKNNRSGIFCSQICVGIFCGKKELEERNGEMGRVCSDCGNWKSLAKFGSGRVCQTCRNIRPKTKFGEYRRRAKHGFGLTFNEFMEFWQLPCWYCGRSIETIGIDRIDNAKGYCKENCVPCCVVCNRMKSSHTKEEFLDTCRRIVKKHGGNNA